MKLYEILLKKVGFGSEASGFGAFQKIYNPIGCVLGSEVRLNVNDYLKYHFSVKMILEHTISVGGTTFQMVDYDLLARVPGELDFWCRLRLVPDQDTHSQVKYRALLLGLFEDLPYNETLHDVVRDDSLRFIVENHDPEDSEKLEYWRVNNVQMPYTSKVKVLADSNENGKLEANEITTSALEIWDYARATGLEGLEASEFLFVEMDLGNGWFKLYRGVEVDPQQIDVFEV